MRKFLASLRFAKNGIKTVTKEEKNFRIEIVIAFGVLFSFFIFDFSYIEKAILIIVMTIVLSAEMANTAIEDLCNKVEPHHDQIIGKIKDIMSGFVLISSFGATLVGLIIYFHHL